MTQDLRGSERILLIEDDDLVRATVSQTLELHGYTVVVAINREEALAVCETSLKEKTPFDLILSDLVMPGMSLAEFRERLRGLALTTRVLYMSGYTDRAIVQHGLLEPDTAFLQKPFTAEGLLRRLRELLEEPNRSAA